MCEYRLMAFLASRGTRRARWTLRALVLLTRVLHVLKLDQNLGLRLHGGVERGSRPVANRAALLAPVSLPPVLADARAPALLADGSPPAVLADARAPALLALASLPPVLADARALALLAVSSRPSVLADPFPRALLAEIPSLLLAVHARLAASPHLAFAQPLPERRSHGGTRGRCDARLRRRAPGDAARLIGKFRSGAFRRDAPPQLTTPRETDSRALAPGRPRALSLARGRAREFIR